MAKRRHALLPYLGVPFLLTILVLNVVQLVRLIDDQQKLDETYQNATGTIARALYQLTGQSIYRPTLVALLPVFRAEAGVALAGGLAMLLTNRGVTAFTVAPAMLVIVAFKFLLISDVIQSFVALKDMAVLAGAGALLAGMGIGGLYVRRVGQLAVPVTAVAAGVAAIIVHSLPEVPAPNIAGDGALATQA